MDSSDIFQDTATDGVEDYEEELTAAEVLQKLEDYWLNEKQSPELLEPKMEIVECMLEQVKHHHHDMISVKHGIVPLHFFYCDSEECEYIYMKLMKSFELVR